MQLSTVSQSVSTSEIDALADALVYAQGGTRVIDLDREEARDMILRLNDKGWTLIQRDEEAASGPIQRALGME